MERACWPLHWCSLRIELAGQARQHRHDRIALPHVELREHIDQLALFFSLASILAATGQDIADIHTVPGQPIEIFYRRGGLACFIGDLTILLHAAQPGEFLLVRSNKNPHLAQPVTKPAKLFVPGHDALHGMELRYKYEISFNNSRCDVTLLAGMHKEDVKAVLRKKFGSVAAFERAHALATQSVSEVFRGRSSKRTIDAIERVLREHAEAAESITSVDTGASPAFHRLNAADRQM